MADYTNYSRISKFIFNGMKKFKKIEFSLIFKENDYSLLLAPDSSTIKSAEESYKLIDDLKLVKSAGVYRRSFSDFSEAFEALIGFFSPNDKNEFTKDFRYFMFDKFDLHTLDKNVKDNIKLPSANITKKLQALQKLYKD